jgi:hypothetical protein
MPRTLWLALICVTLVSALFVLRMTIIGASIAPARPVPYQTDVVPSPAQNDTPPLAKGDRLPLLLYDSSRSAETDPMEVVPPPPEQPPITSPAPVISKRAVFSNPVLETKEVTSWHWHTGAKIAKRSGRR